MDLRDIELPSNRKFGFLFSAIFALLAAFFFYRGSEYWPYIFLGISFVFIVIVFVKDEILLPLNKLWMRFGLLLGLVFGPIVLGVIFFGIFTPIGFVMRLSGRDELRLRLLDTASHWKERDQDDRQAEAFKNQF